MTTWRSVHKCVALSALLLLNANPVKADSLEDVESARRDAIASYTLGIKASVSNVAPTPTVLPTKQWAADARRALTIDDKSVALLANPVYREAAGRYAPSLLLSSNVLLEAWQHIDNQSELAGWRCLVIENGPAMLATSPESVARLLSDLDPLIRTDSSMAVRSAAIQVSESLVRYREETDDAADNARTLVSTIVTSVQGVLRELAAAKRIATPDELQMLSSSFQTLYRSLRHMKIDPNQFRDAICTWEASREVFDYRLSIDYIRLLKLGVGVEPTPSMYEYTKGRAQSTRDMATLDTFKKMEHR